MANIRDKKDENGLSNDICQRGFQS